MTTITVISRNLETTPQSVHMTRLYRVYEAAGTYLPSVRSAVRKLKPREAETVCLASFGWLETAPSRYR